MKIEKIIMILCERTGKNFEEDAKEFYESSAYETLQNTESALLKTKLAYFSFLL